MNIIHLSDLHLNNNLEKLNSFKNEFIPKLADDAQTLAGNAGIDLVIVSGDLIDSGDKFFKFKSASDGFKKVEEFIFTPLLNKLSLDHDRLFFVPGNHDIQSDLDSLEDELKLREMFRKDENINEFIRASRNKSRQSSLPKTLPDGLKRMGPFKRFEELFYKKFFSEHTKMHTYIGSAFVVEVNGIKVGIACINSSWRCYYNPENRLVENLLIGDSQIKMIKDFLRDGNTEINIAVMHHPWQRFWNQSGYSAIRSSFPIVFCGDIHEVIGEISPTTNESLIISIAWGNTDLESDSKRYASGYSFIQENPLKSSIHYREYFNSRFDSYSRLGKDKPGVDIFPPILRRKIDPSYRWESDIWELICGDYLAFSRSASQRNKLNTQLFNFYKNGDQLKVISDFEIKKPNSSSNIYQGIVKFPDGYGGRTGGRFVGIKFYSIMKQMSSPIDFEKEKIFSGYLHDDSNICFAFLLNFTEKENQQITDKRYILFKVNGDTSNFKRGRLTIDNTGRINFNDNELTTLMSSITFNFEQENGLINIDQIKDTIYDFFVSEDNIQSINSPGEKIKTKDDVLKTKRRP